MNIKLHEKKFIEEFKKRGRLSLRSLSSKPKSSSRQIMTHSVKDKMNIVVEGQSGLTSVQDICQREGIDQKTYLQWTDDFLKNHKSLNVEGLEFQSKLSDEGRFNIVIEGLSGHTAVAEICKREKISQELFLKWCDDFSRLRKESSLTQDSKKKSYKLNKLYFQEASKMDVFEYLKTYVDFSLDQQIAINPCENGKLDEDKTYDQIVCLQKINDKRDINQFFEKVNAKLSMDGIFAGCLETFSARKHRKHIVNVPVLSNIYFSGEFVFKRIIPRLSITSDFYFNLTKGRDQLISKAEGLGRLVSCGFKIMDYKSIDGLIYFVVKKVGDPIFDQNPSFGPLYKMPRIGKNGKIIKVYKFRTMHPYSEYLQDYVVRVNGYSETGKPADDFRIPVWGKFMRRYWLDELPQLINVIKGDLKLVGIRPVSERYFKDIPKEMQKLRLTQKPGCIPPYVALRRSGNVMSVLQAEKDYLEEKIRRPYTTDTKYFLKALYNILFKHMRSA